MKQYTMTYGQNTSTCDALNCKLCQHVMKQLSRRQHWQNMWSVQKLEDFFCTLTASFLGDQVPLHRIQWQFISHLENWSMIFSESFQIPLLFSNQYLGAHRFRTWVSLRALLRHIPCLPVGRSAEMYKRVSVWHLDWRQSKDGCYFGVHSVKSFQQGTF